MQSADSVPGRPPPSSGRRLTGVQRCLRTPIWMRSAMTRPPDSVPDAGLLVAGRLRTGAEPALGLGAVTDRWASAGTVCTRRCSAVMSRWNRSPVLADLDRPRCPGRAARAENWWSNRPRNRRPCGPDSELFAWTGDTRTQGTPGTDRRWMELWNHVTMSYRRHDDRSLEPMPQRSVDTGMGAGAAADGGAGPALGVRL